MSSELYSRIQSIADYALRRKAIKALSESDKKSYVRYQTNLRQRKYMTNPVNRTIAYTMNAIHRRNININPERARKNRLKQAEYMRKYRARKKQVRM